VDITYDELLQALINLKSEEEGVIWRRAGLMTLLVERHKAKPSDLASQLCCSASLVREYIRTFKAFPNEADRALDLSFYHHRVCAKTENPHYWLEKSLENGWSVRQLQDALAGRESKPAKDPLEKAKKLWKGIEKLIEEGGEAGEWLMQQIHDTVLTYDNLYT